LELETQHEPPTEREMTEKRNINIRKAPIIVMDIEKEKKKRNSTYQGKERGNIAKKKGCSVQKDRSISIFPVTYLHQ